MTAEELEDIRMKLGQTQEAMADLLQVDSLADADKGARIIRHFEKLGFRCEGEPQDATAFPPGASLPADSGMWQTMRCELSQMNTRDAALYDLTAVVARWLDASMQLASAMRSKPAGT